MQIIILFFFFLCSFTYGQSKLLEPIIQEKIDTNSINPINSILIYIEDLNNNKKTNLYHGFVNRGGKTINGKEQFRIASSTKIFVSTIVLQLVEEGKISLKDKAAKYLDNVTGINLKEFHLFNGKTFFDKITIKQLLAHKTGLANIFTDKEEEFFSLFLENPNKSYSQIQILNLYFKLNLNRSPHFKPGNGWHYSDVNYVLLGLIIEIIENKTLAQSIRKRILDPLNMKNTYFEYYETPLLTQNKIHQYFGKIDMSALNTSFDWAGGGLVSTNQDLALFIKALFKYDLINPSSLRKMISVQFTKKNENKYGLGIYKSNFNESIFYGHYGFYGTYIGYCPKKKIVLSYCISQASLNFDIHSFMSNILSLTNSSNYK